MSSALPKQVQKEIAELAEMEKAMQAPAAPPENGVGENTQTEAPQQTEASVAAETRTTPEPQTSQSEETWEKKYRILQGKYDAEVPRLHQQNKELSAQLQQIQAQVAELAKAKEAPKSQDRLVTEEDESNFGKDLLDVQRRVALEIMREHVAPLQAELSKRDSRIEQLENMLTRTQVDVSSMSFEQQLESLVPGFAKINTDPKWIAFLDSVDEFGDPIRLRAEAAYNAGDAQKVKVFVDKFLASKPTVRNAERQEELRQQVAPPKTASTPAQTPQGERMYTEAEANRLWDKVTKLYTVGKNDEGQALENELAAAYAQGRIRP